MSKRTTVAIDGPVASGKSAVGKLLANRLGYRFLDTGTMYRAVTWIALQRRIDLNNTEILTNLATSLNLELGTGKSSDILMIDGNDISDHLRDQKVEWEVSTVARVSGVRSALVKQQRNFASGFSIVMAGRDIGTVVLPNANVKVFLNASAEIRAKRRYLELSNIGHKPDYQKIVDEITRRDAIDKSRPDSPMVPAKDSVGIHTDHLEIEQVTQKILSMVQISD